MTARRAARNAAATGTAARAARQAVHRRAAVQEYERRSRAGIFRRRHGRRHHHRAVAHHLAVRDRAQFELHLQGQGGRHQAGRPRARRALRARRQRPQGRQPGPHHRPADRRRDRRAFVGGPLRRRARGRFRPAGRGHRRRGRRHRAEARAGRNRARAAQADRKPRGLRLLPARHGAHLRRHARRQYRGAAGLRARHRNRSELRGGLRHVHLLLCLAQSQRLGRRQGPHRRRDRASGASGGAARARRRGRALPTRALRSPSSSASSTTAWR